MLKSKIDVKLTILVILFSCSFFSCIKLISYKKIIVSRNPDLNYHFMNFSLYTKEKLYNKKNILSGYFFSKRYKNEIINTYKNVLMKNDILELHYMKKTREAFVLYYLYYKYVTTEHGNYIKAKELVFDNISSRIKNNFKVFDIGGVFKNYSFIMDDLIFRMSTPANDTKNKRYIIEIYFYDGVLVNND